MFFSFLKENVSLCLVLRKDMLVITDIFNCPDLKESVVTIGTFDGVHLGHQKIIQKLVTDAQKFGLCPTIFTFYPHPRVVLNPENPIKQIQTIEERTKTLQSFGIEQLIIQPFNENFANLSAEDFVKNILVEKLKTKKIIVGYDHRFGKNRQANITDLELLAKKYNFEVEQIQAQEINSISVSSTKIRKALEQGDLHTANAYLGRYFSAEGKVIHGQKLGRTIGFPTANLDLNTSYKINPKNGVYSVQTKIDNKIFFGMMNFGEKPTFNQNPFSAEVHLFDFQGDLYGKTLTIEFINYIRPQQKFEDISTLKKQLDTDKQIIKKQLNLSV